MRVLRSVVVVGLLGLLAFAVTACSGESGSSLPRPSRAFCQAAYDFDTNAPKLVHKINQQIKLVRKMADHAPKDIQADANLYLDAMQRRAKGDKSVVGNPKIETAVKNVERRAANGCDLYKQDPANNGI
jgi:hypothetical protein